MKISNSNIGIKMYLSNSIPKKIEREILKEKDRIEISNVGKKLIDYSIDFKEEHRAEKINEIKKKIDSKEYEINTDKLVSKILKVMGEKNEY